MVDGGGNPVSTQYASTTVGTTIPLAGIQRINLQTAHGRRALGKTKLAARGSTKLGIATATHRAVKTVVALILGYLRKSSQTLSMLGLCATIPMARMQTRIQPVTINQCQIGGGGNPYSMSELRDLANNSGGAVTNVSAVSVSHDSAGQTTSVHLSTNRGNIDIPGSEFKSSFNLRAPGLRIPQVDLAFNINLSSSGCQVSLTCILSLKLCCIHSTCNTFVHMRTSQLILLKVFLLGQMPAARRQLSKQFIC